MLRVLVFLELAILMQSTAAEPKQITNELQEMSKSEKYIASKASNHLFLPNRILNYFRSHKNRTEGDDNHERTKRQTYYHGGLYGPCKVNCTKVKKNRTHKAIKLITEKATVKPSNVGINKPIEPIKPSNIEVNKPIGTLVIEGEDERMKPGMVQMRPGNVEENKPLEAMKPMNAEVNKLIGTLVIEGEDERMKPGMVQMRLGNIENKPIETVKSRNVEENKPIEPIKPSNVEVNKLIGTLVIEGEDERMKPGMVQMRLGNVEENKPIEPIKPSNVEVNKLIGTLVIEGEDERMKPGMVQMRPGNVEENKPIETVKSSNVEENKPLEPIKPSNVEVNKPIGTLVIEGEDERMKPGMVQMRPGNIEAKKPVLVTEGKAAAVTPTPEPYNQTHKSLVYIHNFTGLHLNADKAIDLEIADANGDVIREHIIPGENNKMDVVINIEDYYDDYGHIDDEDVHDDYYYYYYEYE